LGAAVVGNIDGIALHLRHQDLQIGGDYRGIAINGDVRQAGEMREPAINRGLVIGAKHLIGDILSPARAGEILAAIEKPVFHPACRDMILACGVGAGRMAGDEVIDFESVFDGANAVFEAFVVAHGSLPYVWAIANGEERIRRTAAESSLFVIDEDGMTSPIAPASWAEKNSRPSGMAIMARAPQPSTGIAYSPITLPSGAMRPILLATFSVNQRSPSGATVTPRKEAFGVFTGHSLIRPCKSMRPSALALVSTNQMLPSGCAAMARGSLFGVGILYSLTCPSMLMRPIWPASYSLNQRSPSRTTSDSGRHPGVSPCENSVTAPHGVMRATRLTCASENHTFPSGPAAMPSGPAPTVGSGNSVVAPDGVMRPIRLLAFSQNHNAPSAAGVMPIGRLSGVGV